MRMVEAAGVASLKDIENMELIGFSMSRMFTSCELSRFQPFFSESPERLRLGWWLSQSSMSPARNHPFRHLPELER